MTEARSAQFVRQSKARLAYERVAISVDNEERVVIVFDAVKSVTAPVEQEICRLAMYSNCLLYTSDAADE